MSTKTLSRQAVRRLLLICLSVAPGLLAPLHGKAQTWREVQSPHFRVVTDGTDHDGRDVAKEFEQMRSVFASRLPKANLDPGAPLLVVAVREPGLHSLSPVLWKQRDRIAGQFFQHWERQFALVRLDSFGDLNQAVVFHEYTHSILHANLHWLPMWLDEGMAEFYAYTRFQADHIYLGAPPVRLDSLRGRSIIPIPEMLQADYKTYARDENREELFYGEAWAMIHFLTFAPDMEGGAKLNRFIALIESGMQQTQAFEQAFGDPKAIESRLSTYVSGLTVRVNLLPPADKIDVKSYPAKVLTAAEAAYELGTFDVGVYDSATGSKRLEAAEAADPAMAGPHEEIGFLLWQQGKDEEARAEWQKAVAADAPASYRAAFALLMSGTPLRQQTPQQLAETAHALGAINAQAPRFAPVLAELALVQWRLGQINPAYKSALAAEKLEPWRAGYHVLTGHILLQGHQPKIAESYARMVAARWPGADHDEAVDLWNQVPPSARAEGPPLTPSFPSDAVLVRGTIVSSSCEKNALNLVLQPSTPGAPPLTVGTSGPYESGFSDTFWFGEDHYNPCFHLSGLTAIVLYKETGTGTPKLIELQLRDDLPQFAPSAPKPTNTDMSKSSQ